MYSIGFIEDKHTFTALYYKCFVLCTVFFSSFPAKRDCTKRKYLSAIRAQNHARVYEGAGLRNKICRKVCNLCIK